MRLPMEEVARMLGTSCGAPKRAVEGYSIDSRTISRGHLFFAIRGPKRDGHQFVHQALERGAAGAVVEQAFLDQAPPKDAPNLLPVRDSTEALQRLAHEVRKKWARPVIAVTGSTGKTTTKELIATLLAPRFSVHKSPGNLNNDYGVPLALLALEPGHEVAVMELAMSAPREIARLARIAAPQIGVVTNVAPVHLEFFDSVESIGRAKRELIESLPPTGTAVLNHDDARVRQLAEGFRGRVVTFGFEPGADVQGSEVSSAGAAGTEFRVEGPGLEGRFSSPLPGRHNVHNALAALATASLFEIPAAELRQALASFQNLPSRSEILTLDGEITLVNDSYNSNPLAMERMLETLAAWPGSRRRIVVAGEMLELGPTAPDWHRMIGRKCVESRVDWIVAVQGDARFIAEGAMSAGLPPERAKFFSDAAKAAEYCGQLLEPGDVVLVKGSRAVHLEKVIELLRAASGARQGARPRADNGRGGTGGQRLPEN